jgi:hypothetical protein
LSRCAEASASPSRRSPSESASTSPKLRRYQAGTSQPTLDVLRRTAVALSCSADALLFDQDEHGPVEELRLQFEAASRLDAAEIHIVKALLEGLLLKHEAKRLAAIG